MSTSTKEWGNYRVTLNASLHQYAHLCSAFQLYDVSIMYYEKGKFGWQEIGSFDDVPDWLVTNAHIIFGKLIQSIGMDDKKVIIGQSHTGTDSGWSYISQSQYINPMYEYFSTDSMTLFTEKSGERVLTEWVLPKKAIYAEANKDFIIPDGVIVDKLKPDAGLTEDKLKEYLQTL